MKPVSLLALAAALLAATALPLHAQEWPNKSIRVVFPYQPGGGGDIITRLVMDRVGRKLGQQFVIDNRSGAGGIIGADIVAKSKPDGYTFVVSGMGSHVVAPVLNQAPFDPMKDFTHVALFGGPPLVLAVHPDFQARTLQQYLELTRTLPDGIVFGSPGPGTHGHLLGEMVKSLSGGKMLHAPYKGGGPAAGDLVAGHIPSAIVTLGSSASFVRGGKLRLLAIASPRRVPDFPTVPTFVEAGYKDIVATTWFSLSGPAGLPRPIAAKLNAEVRAAVAIPEVRERLMADGIEPGDLDVDAFTEFFRAEIARWAPLARAVK